MVPDRGIPTMKTGCRVGRPAFCEALEQGRPPRLDQFGNEPLVLGRIVHQVSPLEFGKGEGVGLACALGRFRVVADARPRRLPGQTRG